MTSKLDKLLRQQYVLNELLKDTFNIKAYIEKYGKTERTFRRDLAELSESGELFSNKLDLLRKVCLGKLTKKAGDGKLSNTLMLQIILSGIAQKVVTDSTVTQTNTNTNIEGAAEAVIAFSREQNVKAKKQETEGQ